MNERAPDDVPQSSLPKKTSPGVLAGVLLLVVAAVGIGGFALYRKLNEPAPPPPVVEAPKEPEPAAGPEVNVDDADAVLAEQSKALAATAPEAAGWLAEPGMLRRVVAAVWQVSQGESPREPLRFLAPQAEYTVISRDAKVYQSPESEARYDFVAKALGAVNAKDAGAIYRTAQRFADAAFKEITPTGSRFGSAIDKAIERLAATPLRDEPLEVVPIEKGIGYRFADPALEALDPVQKHLLRMGPVNARVVLSQLKAIRAASMQ